MSHRVGELVNDANERSMQALQPYESVWLTHWMRTSCVAAEETGSPNVSGNEELDYVTRNDDLTRGLEDPSRCVKGLDKIKTRTLEIGDDIIKISSKGIVLGSLFKDGQDNNEMQALRPEFAHIVERGKAVDCKSGIQFPSLIPGDPAANGIPSRGCHSVGEGSSDYPPKWMRTHFARKDSIFASNPLQERFVESLSHIVPYRFGIEKYEADKGKAASVVSRQPECASRRMLEDQQCHKHRHSIDLFCERKVYCPSQLDNYLDECFRESISCDLYLSTFGRGWFPMMKKCSGIRLCPSQSNPSEESETKKPHNDCYSLLKLQNCVHNVETTRTCTTVDALEGTAEGCPRFSQTTNGLLITKKSDINAFKVNDMFRSTRVITETNGNISSKFHCLLPFFGQDKQQVICLNSLIDSEVKENIRDMKAFRVTVRNESLAETDTMDMDSFKDKNSRINLHFKDKNSRINLHSGTNSAASTKAFSMESNIPLQSGRQNDGLPDMNLELPALPDAVNSSENTAPSSSKTQNLEMDKLLEHVEQPKPKSNFSLDDFSNADPGNRWVKRLKLSSSDSSAQVTKSSDFASSSSQEKMSKLFSGIIRSSTTSLALPVRKQHARISIPSDKSGDFLKKDEDTFMENPKNEGKALLLSDGWIKRWMHNGRRIIEKKPETEVVCDLQSSKLTLEKLQKEQFPSIAAMALMGKALTCFQGCELQKRGSLTVWNTKTF